MQALFDLWIEAFFHENPHVQHAINSSLEKITDAFKLSDDTNKQGAIMKVLICVNLWDPMKQVMLLNWDELYKKIKLKSSTKEVQLKSTRALINKFKIIHGIAVVQVIIHTGRF